ncbi:WD40/YVTN/BNR-like repeat-containing protein [Bacillus sp. 1NLA3E]|uniref:WD40/YVTN/BNR-like repeat-containing protein n=1 Tax=Bacillus sp. 1NLA3E TaxID=666686 RepID=UPI000247EB72|nr:oxidoreductase [Bacillus sp. 1NLA3E]AGK52364.1 oxidoreductase [Bacillus sp. 1NLA3E]
MTAFVRTPDWKAFENGGDTTIKILKSIDKGKTWDTTSVLSPFPSARLRLLGFTSEQNGYLILSGDRTMSSEANAILKTNDGGKTWVNAGTVQNNYRLVTSGGFINNTLGFISFGTLNEMDQPGRPSLYRTIDGGEDVG